MDGGERAVGRRRGDRRGEGEPADHGIRGRLDREEDGAGPGEQEDGDQPHQHGAGDEDDDRQVRAT